MPLYEYRCQRCRRKTTVLVRGFGESPSPACQHCGSPDLARLVSTFVHRRSWGESLDSVPDEAFSDVDEENPRELARWMRRMRGQMGEVTPEFDQVVEELEAGEMPGDLDDGAEGEESFE